MLNWRYIKTQSVPRSKHSVSVIQTSQLMLYREIIAVCSQIHTKHINTLCGQNAQLLNHWWYLQLYEGGTLCVGNLLRFYHVFFSLFEENLICCLLNFSQFLTWMQEWNMFPYQCFLWIFALSKSQAMFLTTIAEGTLQFMNVPNNQDHPAALSPSKAR